MLNLFIQLHQGDTKSLPDEVYNIKNVRCIIIVFFVVPYKFTYRFRININMLSKLPRVLVILKLLWNFKTTLTWSVQNFRMLSPKLHPYTHASNYLAIIELSQMVRTSTHGPSDIKPHSLHLNWLHFALLHLMYAERKADFLRFP